MAWESSGRASGVSLPKLLEDRSKSQQIIPHLFTNSLETSSVLLYVYMTYISVLSIRLRLHGELFFKNLLRNHLELSDFSDKSKSAAPRLLPLLWELVIHAGITPPSRMQKAIQGTLGLPWFTYLSEDHFRKSEWLLSCAIGFPQKRIPNYHSWWPLLPVTAQLLTCKKKHARKNKP